MSTNDLNVHEKAFIAFALFSMAMRTGPPCWPVIERIINKIGILPEFEHFAKDWISHAKAYHKNEDPAARGSSEDMPGF